MCYKLTTDTSYIIFFQVVSVLDLLMPSDVYLLEERSGSVKSLLSVPLALNHARLETTLLTVLQCQGKSGVARAFKLRSSVIGSLFKLTVGGEKVSCSKTVQMICHHQMQDNPAANVNIPEEFKLKYFRLSRSQQEHMGSCLLQALTLYYLIEESNSAAIFT